VGSCSSHSPGLLALACGLLLWPAPAHAANTNQPRVPPSFLGTACIEVVDRSVDPVWRFDVGIPFEDTGLTEDEPPDGRTFQFFALCRQPGPLETLPPWVSAADAEAAAMLDPTIELPAPGEPLDESAAWADCVEPITTAAQRMPITCEATAGGATWDTTSVPAGAHAVWGYTYEPAQNLWTPRDGVVRIIDGDEASAGPAVSFSWPLTEVTAGLHAGVRVAGCTSGMPGTTVVLSWATAVAVSEQGDTAWQPFAELSDPTPTFDVSFVPPEDAEFAAVFLRAEAVDPQGRRFVAHTREPVVFLSGCDEPMGGARSLPDHCRVGTGSPPVPEGTRDGGGCTDDETGALDESGGNPSDTGQGTSASTSSDETGGAAATGDSSGCSCRHAPDHRPTLLLPGLLALTLTRRRRRLATR
jgi:MYXO-CTERM domain-containing protein